MVEPCGWRRHTYTVGSREHGKRELSVCPPIFPSLFSWYWGLNSGPTPQDTPPALYLWRIFWDRVSQTICPGWFWTMILWSLPPEKLGLQGEPRALCQSFLLASLPTGQAQQPGGARLTTNLASLRIQHALWLGTCASEAGMPLPSLYLFVLKMDLDAPNSPGKMSHTPHP
jgi:hypothetical protein